MDPKRETMSSLLATQTATRVARDLGYPKLEVPPPPTPVYARPEEVIYEHDDTHWVVSDPIPKVDLSVPAGLKVFFVLCVFAGFAILVASGIFIR